MGIWGRFRAAFTGGSDRVPDDVQPVPTGTTDTVRAVASSEPMTLTQLRDVDRERAKTAGQNIRAYRAGYIPATEAKTLLVPDENSRPPLRLVTADSGFELAIPDGRLLDYKTLALRHFGIFAFRVVGMSYQQNPGQPFTFRDGQPVGIRREPDNQHDPYAVALTTGNPPRRFGYVNKQRARWVGELLDDGEHLEAIIIQSSAASPRALITTPNMLAHLRRP
jgi:hypothetical protein